MIELIYASAATRPMTPPELARLLTMARERNAVDDITGVLLYHQGSFLQVLEGEEAAVEATVERIRHDPRHEKIILLLRAPIEERAFFSWRMGYLSVSPETKAALAGFTDFLATGALGLRNSEAAVQRVLAAFRGGRYRQAIR